MSSDKHAAFNCPLTQLSVLGDAERKFRKSCEQIIILNEQLEHIKARYNRAMVDNCKCFRYNLRLKMAVIEGVRNMYYDYAHVQAEVVAEMRERLFGEVVTDSDSDAV